MSEKEKDVCIHGHFYQPPRENPWLEQVENQESAYPYHDWNERVTAECYAPNCVSRIMDPQWRIIALVNNYSKISFNFGPTLLYWLVNHSPDVYKAILDADKESMKNFSGHGSAIAQVYNHMIMPLANRRDKDTQVKWGIVDFKARFERLPEGMWLPETAVDIETLEVLAENNIKFTILSPHQAAKTRKIGEDDWVDVSNEKIEPRRAYICKLPSAKSINLFFYDKRTAIDIAFGSLLENGEAFAKRLSNAFKDASDENRLVSVASDGELYGHHHPHGDMTLAYCLHYLSANNLAKISNFGEFLEKNPPQYEVQIVENSSWSCAHGVERWQSDCGDNTGTKPGWKQGWRKPLRDAMNWLRDQLAQPFESAAGEYLQNPWQVRNKYIDVVLDRSSENVDRFLSEQAIRHLNNDEKRRVIKLLEMQRQAMLIFTSCGWFFDEISGIETVQVMMYAARAIQLANELLGLNLESDYLKILQEAQSNIPEFGTGARAYEMFVKPAVVDLTRVAAQHAMLSLFSNEKQSITEKHPQERKQCCFTIDEEEMIKQDKGNKRLSICKLRIRSDVTLDEDTVSCVALWLGNENVVCGARNHLPEDEYKSIKNEILSNFDKGPETSTIVIVTKAFGENTYTLKNMFKDDRQRIINFIVQGSVKKTEELFVEVYKENAVIMQFLNDLHLPQPGAFRAAANISANAEIARILSSETIDVEALNQAVSNALLRGVEFDTQLLGLKASDRIAKELEEIQKAPSDVKRAEDVEKIVRLLRNTPIRLDFWKSQNTAFKIAQDSYKLMKEKADEASKAWVSAFERLTDALGMRLG